jgi:outer membrane receptor protein involved in Fe transport
LNFIQYLPWATITPGVFYRYTKDEITRTKTLLDSISTLNTFENINSSRSYGGELIVSSQPAKFLNINGTLSYYKSEVDGTNLKNGTTNSTNSWSARLLSTVTLPEDLSLQASYFYTGKRLTPQGTISPFQSFDAAVKKDLLDKKLSISLRASDIFNTGKFTTSFDDVDFSEYSERVRDTRGLFLNVSYKFGEQQKKQPRERKRKDDGNDNEVDDFDY